jgi:hypothetical protein
LSLCILAVDYHFATTQKCTQIPALNNNANYAKNLTLLSQQLLPLTFEGNLTNAIYAAQSMFVAMKAPKRPPSSPGLCSLDYHCNGQGKCQSVLGNQKCACNKGRQGSFCQFTESQFSDFLSINTKIINALYKKMSTVYQITVNEIELVAVIFRGILKDPDVVDDSLLESIILMLEMVGDAPNYAHYPITIDIRDMYMDSLSAVMNKVFHSYKVKRAYPNVVKLQNQEPLSS